MLWVVLLVVVVAKDVEKGTKSATAKIVTHLALDLVEAPLKLRTLFGPKLVATTGAVAPFAFFSEILRQQDQREQREDHQEQCPQTLDRARAPVAP